MTVNRSSSITKEVQSSVVKGSAAFGDDVLTDGPMQTWSDTSTLTNWTNMDFQGSDGSITQEDTIKPDALTYSTKITSGSAGGDIHAAFQEKASLTLADVYRLKFQGYQGTSSTLSVIVFNGSPGVDATHNWDWVAGDWALLDGGAPSANGTLAQAVDGTWTTYTASSVITVPASLKLVPTFAEMTGSASTVYVTDVDLEKLEAAPAVQIFQNRSNETLTNLDASDRIVEFTFAGSPAAVGLALGGTGVFETDLTALSFAGTDTRFGSASDDANPVIKGDFDTDVPVLIKTGSTALLGGTAAIDFKATGPTTSYTVPTGYKVIFTNYTVEIVSADTPSGDYALSVGTVGGSYTDVGSALGGGTVTGAHNGIFTSPAILGAGSEIFINVSSADSGTAITGKLHLFGFLQAV